jgi:hypothetical protein
MPVTVNPAYKGKVTLGTTTVGAMKTWGISGMANKLINAEVFEDEFEKFQYGQGNGGKVSFSGFYDATDTGGQTALLAKWIAKTTLSTVTTDDPRVYYSATGYFELSTGAVCLVESVEIGEADLSNLVPIKFTLQVSGGYFQKHA